MLMLMGSAFTVLAKNVVLEIKVHGQCGECKERIEKALDKPGITYASWDVTSKMLTVKFNDKKYSEDDIHKILNGIGYNTEKSKASNDQINKLPACCRPGGH